MKQIFFRLALRLGFGGGGQGYTPDPSWILFDGTWNDSGTWIDSQQWSD